MIHRREGNIDKILGIQYHFYRRKILQNLAEIFISKRMFRRKWNPTDGGLCYDEKTLCYEGTD